MGLAWVEGQAEEEARGGFRGCWCREACQALPRSNPACNRQQPLASSPPPLSLPLPLPSQGAWACRFGPWTTSTDLEGAWGRFHQLTRPHTSPCLKTFDHPNLSGLQEEERGTARTEDSRKQDKQEIPPCVWFVFFSTPGGVCPLKHISSRFLVRLLLASCFLRLRSVRRRSGAAFAVGLPGHVLCSVTFNHGRRVQAS